MAISGYLADSDALCQVSTSPVPYSCGREELKEVFLALLYNEHKCHILFLRRSLTLSTHQILLIYINADIFSSSSLKYLCRDNRIWEKCNVNIFAR